MLTFNMQTLVGIGPIKFGMTRSEVRDILADLGQHSDWIKLGLFAVVEMILFVAILLFGLAYAWGRKVLEWA